MTRESPVRIAIAGGGVAALETVVALRVLAGPRPHISLIAPDPELVARPASVAVPFGFGLPGGLALSDVRRRAPFEQVTTTLREVDADGHMAVGADGALIPYDQLVIAVGALTRPALAGAIDFAGPRDADAVTAALDATARLAFVLPSASSWAMPVYELAIMAATELRSRGREPEITVVTPEPSPLWAFGAEASAAVGELLAQRGIALRTGAHAVEVWPGGVLLDDGGPPVRADRVIALPRLEGPAIPGLPHDGDGFIPVDPHGRVDGLTDVYAAGDATIFPLKQGGLATQQADAVAEAIAAGLGVALTPAPFRPVLRGLLLTGGAPLYLRTRLGPAGEPLPTASAVSQRPLWSPPGKLAGRYLAPLLATARPPSLATSHLEDLPALAPLDDTAHPMR